MEQEVKKPKFEIGDLCYLTCDTTRKCLMSVANIKDELISTIWTDKNNVPQSIVDLHQDCLSKLNIK